MIKIAITYSWYSFPSLRSAVFWGKTAKQTIIETDQSGSQDCRDKTVNQYPGGQDGENITSYLCFRLSRS